MSAPSHKISLPRIILVWCQTRLASGAGKAHKKKSISDNARDRKLAAAQIRLPTFDKQKRANFVHPSNGCSPIHSSRGYENARARAGEAERGVRGKSFQPLDSLMEGEEKKRSSNSFYGRKEARCTFSTPLLSRVDRALEVRQLRLKDASTSVGVRGRREGNPSSPSDSV